MSRQNRIPAWETIATIAAIFSLWPAVLQFWAASNESVNLEDMPLAQTIDWGHWGWNVLLVAALVLMMVVAVRRVGRIKQQSEDGSDSDGPVDPYASMYQAKDKDQRR